MIYPIYVYGSDVLRKEASDVALNDQDLPKLIEDMFETMSSSEGVGLAAPQIGKDLRIFVVDLSRYAGEEPNVKGFRQAFVNPEIIGESDQEVLMSEGCLSIPGLYEDIWRPESITIRFHDKELNQKEETFTGYIARVIQHEYDHLEGVLFTDHLSALRKTLVRGKLNSMSKGKYAASYKTRQSK